MSDYFPTWVRYERSLQRYWCIVQARQPRSKPVVILNWGLPGTGKTRAVWDNHNHNDIWSWPGGAWFDQYTAQPVALFDDFDEGPIPYRLLLKILDRYRILVPTKGSHVFFQPKTIYITSNVHPSRWYPRETDVNALLRRIDQINEFT